MQRPKKKKSTLAELESLVAEKAVLKLRASLGLYRSPK